MYGEAKQYCERGQRQKDQKKKCVDLATPMRESCEYGIHESRVWRRTPWECRIGP